MLILESPYPIGVELHAGEDWPPFRPPPPPGLTGWVRMSRVRLDLPFGSYGRTIVSAVDDYGDAIDRWTLIRLTEMRASEPQFVDELPPDEALDDIEDGSYWDFLGTTDLEAFALLDRAHAAREIVIRRLEKRVEETLDVMQHCIRRRNRVRRDPRTDPTKRQAIAHWLERANTAMELLARCHRREAARLRGDTEVLEAQVLEAIQETPPIEPWCTFRFEVVDRGYAPHRSMAAGYVRSKLSSGVDI